MRKTYCGYRSRNIWNVCLWLHNDEGLYVYMKDCIRRTRNRAEAVALMMESLPPKTPDGAPYTVTAVRKAMAEL